MKKIVLFLLLFTGLCSQAQTDNRSYKLEELTQKPALVSGESFENYFKKNFHPQKPVAAATDISFLIEKGGVAHNITLFKIDDPKAKTEAERVLKAAGKWKPGTKDGKIVRVLYRFTYQSLTKK